MLAFAIGIVAKECIVITSRYFAAFFLECFSCHDETPDTHQCFRRRLGHGKIDRVCKYDITASKGVPIIASEQTVSHLANLVFYIVTVYFLVRQCSLDQLIAMIGQELGIDWIAFNNQIHVVQTKKALEEVLTPLDHHCHGASDDHLFDSLDMLPVAQEKGLNLFDKIGKGELRIVVIDRLFPRCNTRGKCVGAAHLKTRINNVGKK